MYNYKQEDIWPEETYDRIINEIQEYLQLYLFKDASIDSELFINQLFNLDEDNLLTMKKLHFLISSEVKGFIKILPFLVRNLSHSTNKEEIETHGNIIGQINWNQTFKNRMKTGLKDKSLFVCNTNKKLYDLPENQLLKYMLTKINKFIKDINISYDENYKEEVINYQEYLNNIHIITHKIVKNVHLKNVELPRHITTKIITKTIKSHNNLYEELINVYRLYEKLFITNDESILLELLNKQVLKPNNKDTLYEVYILFKIIEKINQENIQLKLLKAGNDYIIYSDFTDKQINIYYQHLPEAFKNNNIKKLQPYYNLELYNKRPDIIIEYIKNNKKTYKIIEIKRTEDPGYIRDSIYKVFAYLKDYEKVPLVKPNILVVWDKIELITQDNLEKQDLIILNHNEFLRNIYSLVLYEKELINPNDYWKQLQQFHEKLYSPIGDVYDDNWYAIDLDDIPYKIANIQLKLNNKSIETQLYNIFFKDIYDYLYENRNKIEEEIGEKLSWQATRNSKKSASSISLKKKLDCNNKNNWQECIEWHSDSIYKFKDVFKKYLKQYDIYRWRKDIVIETYTYHRKYWNKLSHKIKNQNVYIENISSGGGQVIKSNSMISRYVLRTDYSKRTLSVELFIPHGNKLYNHLKNDKEDIEAEFGENLTWVDENKYSSKILINNFKYNPKHEELWNYCIKWHLDTLKKFYEVFNPRVKEFESNQRIDL